MREGKPVNLKPRRCLSSLSAAGAAAAALGLLLLTILPFETAAGLFSAAARGVRYLVEMVTKRAMAPAAAAVVQELAAPACQALGYFLLGLLLWASIRLYGKRTDGAARSELIAVPSLLAFGGSFTWAALNQLLLLFLPGRGPSLSGLLWSAGGGLCAAAGLALFFFLLRRFPRVVNRETVSYIVFGVLTTVVNIVSYLAASQAFGSATPLLTTLNNTIAWVLSVLFAYVVNKLFVFQSKTDSRTAAWREFGLFIGARIFSYVVDVACMVLMVNLLGINEALSKIVSNIFVMIMNYFFSRWIIFKKKEPAEEL